MLFNITFTVLRILIFIFLSIVFPKYLFKLLPLIDMTNLFTKFTLSFN